MHKRNLIYFLCFLRLFNVFVLWLEEESFQKGDTYIPSLPKQYDAYRLAKIMQNQQVKLQHDGKGGNGTIWDSKCSLLDTADSWYC